MKLTLSRLAKKFRDEDASSLKSSPKPAKPVIPPARKPVVPIPEPVIQLPEPVVELTVVLEEVTAPRPKGWPVKVKRTRFVREKAVKRTPVTLPPLLPSNKLAAKLMTKNVVPLPKDEPKPSFPK